MRLSWILPAVCAVLLGLGCAGSKTPTQKQAAAQQWGRARANVMYGLAKDQYATGNFEPSRKTVVDALKLDPENGPLLVLSARLAIEGGQLEQAEKDLEHARKVNPKDAEADYLSGVVYQRWQKPDLACKFYESASEKQPTELAYLMAKGEMLVSMGRSEEALRLLQDRVVYFENSAVIRDAVGQLLMQFKKYNEAAEMLRKASVLSAGDMDIQEHLALAMYFAGKYDEAIEPLIRLTSRETYENRADLQLALGRSLLETGRLREARQSLETAARLDDSQSTTWLSLARVAMQLGDEKRAELSIKRAQAADPASSEGRLLMGYLRLRQGKVNEALNSFQRASSLDNQDTVSVCMIGYALQRLGRLEQASQYYAKALKMKPGDEMARKLLASVDLND